MEILLLLLLVFINALFAMSEMSIVSARKAKLQNLADGGDSRALTVLYLQNHPGMFLSTIQVGITLVGTLTGIIGEGVLAEPIARWLAQWALIAPYAKIIALTIVVTLITYLSVVLGELVPKRLALLAPEKLARVMVVPLMALTTAAKPFVWLLTASSNAVIKLLRMKASKEPPVTDDEINVLMEQGAEAGVFHESEQALVSNVLSLDEQRVSAIMTARQDLVVLDIDEPDAQCRQQISEAKHSRLVVCRGGLERILGVLWVADLLRHTAQGKPITNSMIEAVLRPAQFVPETMTTTQLLEQFRITRSHFTLIVDEYGEVEGVATLTDVLGAIVGDLPDSHQAADADATQREDGSWLIDGNVSIERFNSLISPPLPASEEKRYQTLAGYILHKLGRIPKVGERFTADELTLEIIDLDRHRIDKVLVQLPLQKT
jgi:putative hemolysin